MKARTFTATSDQFRRNKPLATVAAGNMLASESGGSPDLGRI
jgi:hypothetical protein